RINLILTEDSVTGSSTDYDQHNAYEGGYYGEMGGYELLPYIIPASMMHYDHVARYLTDGWDGKAESHPTTVSDGDTVYNHYSLEIDADWDVEKLNVIATVLDYNTGKFVNANKVKLTELIAEPVDTTIIDTTVVEGIHDLQQNKIHVYPNPANAFCFVDLELNELSDVQLTITDITGKVIIVKDYGLIKDKNVLQINTALLEQGVYILTMQIEGSVISKRLTVIH
ncbi:MAG: T9SS type A sorting domain-containing protein, partial [Fimbriimonadaceae bacterium]|nr:T9SS type A sorting domain-containing protein [Chitinophagales bacterium]